VGRSDLASEETELEVEAVEWRKGSFNKFHTFPSDCDSDSGLSSPIAMPSQKHSQHNYHLPLQQYIVNVVVDRLPKSIDQSTNILLYHLNIRFPFNIEYKIRKISKTGHPKCEGIM